MTCIPASLLPLTSNVHFSKSLAYFVFITNLNGRLFTNDIKAARLEQEAHPALDKLTSMISALNLERVRQIKSRLVAITGRVQKVYIFLIGL